MNVLSLFDGISCGRLALESAGIPVERYFASEIDRYAIQVSQKNWPDIERLGEVHMVSASDLPKIDLLLAGPPCQGFSLAGKGLNFDDPRSQLFFEAIRIKNECKPKWFLFENVLMKGEVRDRLSELIGVEPVMIDSALVSAQSRKRLYWTNIPVEQPEDKGIVLRDVVMFNDWPVCAQINFRYIEGGNIRTYTDKCPMIPAASGGGHTPYFVKSSLMHTEAAIQYMDRCVGDGRSHWDFAHHSDVRNSKSAAVVANFLKGVPYNVLKDWDCIRKFHPIECERLQTLPDNYTEGVSNTQRYKTVGNGWTRDVIAHILSGIKQ